MNLQDLKRILEKEGGKIIVVEDGKPIMVITPYENGEGKEESKPAPPSLERPSPPREESEELTIDDLPL